MRAIITDPLYKALNTLAEKKAAWQKVIDWNYPFLLRYVFTLRFAWFLIVHRWLKSQGAGGKGSQVGETPTFHPELTQREPQRSSLHNIRHYR